MVSEKEKKSVYDNNNDHGQLTTVTVSFNLANDVNTSRLSLRFRKNVPVKKQRASIDDTYPEQNVSRA